jgi:hypothetical protein
MVCVAFSIHNLFENGYILFTELKYSWILHIFLLEDTIFKMHCLLYGSVFSPTDNRRAMIFLGFALQVRMGFKSEKSGFYPFCTLWLTGIRLLVDDSSKNGESYRVEVTVVSLKLIKFDSASACFVSCRFLDQKILSWNTKWTKESYPFVKTKLKVFFASFRENISIVARG